MIDKIINFIVEGNGMELISASIGLLGVYWTIQYTRNQFNDDKRMGIKPYLDLSICNEDFANKFTASTEDKEYKNSYGSYFNSSTYYVDLKSDCFKNGSLGFFYAELDLENIGLGHAIDCKVVGIYGENNITRITEDISILKKDYKSKIFLVITKVLKNEYVDLLEKFINCEEEKEKVREKFWLNKKFPNNYTVLDKLKNQSREEIYIDIEYKDMLNNKYKKTFCLELHFYIEKDLFLEKEIIKGTTRVLRTKYKEKLIKRKRRGKICNS